MAQLTWRDVAAPDLSGALQGVNQFSRLLDNAFGGAEQAVTGFDKTLDEQANRRIAERSLAAQDSESYKAAIADGSILGSDAKRASIQMLSDLDARRGQLLSEGLTGQQLKQSEYNFGRQTKNDAAVDAAAPFRADALRAFSTGDIAGARKILADHAPELAGLKFEDQLATFTGGQAIAEGNLNYDRGVYGFGREKIDAGRADLSYNEEREALKADGELSQFLTPDDKLNHFQKMRFSSPVVRAAVLRSLGGYESVLGGGSSGGGDSSANPLTRITGGGEGNLGLGSLPPAVQTVGQFVGFAKTLNQRGQASSATGLYQITGETASEFGPKALGAGWQKANFADPDVQDKMAKAIFQDAMSRPTEATRVQKLMNRWTSLNRAQATAMVRNGKWEAARDQIMRGESGAQGYAAIKSAFERQKTGFDSAYDQGRQQGNVTNADPGAEAMFKGVNDKRTPTEVATILAKQLGNGATPYKIERAIKDLQGKARDAGYNLSALSAAEAIRAKQSTNNNWIFDGNLGGNLDYDEDAATEMVLSIPKGGNRVSVRSQTQQSQMAAARTDAEKNYNNAVAALEAKKRGLALTGAQGSTTREEAAVERAAVMRSSLEAYGDDPANGMTSQDFKPKVAAPPPPKRTVTPKAPPPKSAATPAANPERAFQRTPDGKSWKYNTAADRRARIGRVFSTPFTAPVNWFARGVDSVLAPD